MKCDVTRKQGRKLYIDAGKDLKIHKILKMVTLLTLLRKIELEMLPHLKTDEKDLKIPNIQPPD